MKQRAELSGSNLGIEVENQLRRLVEVRAALAEVRGGAISPAVERALEMADIEIFLALGYLGYREQLFPEQIPTQVSR